MPRHAESLAASHYARNSPQAAGFVPLPIAASHPPMHEYFSQRSALWPADHAVCAAALERQKSSFREERSIPLAPTPLIGAPASEGSGLRLDGYIGSQVCL